RNERLEQERRHRSTFLAYNDPDGRYADFHALRHTFITNMVKSGIAPKAAQCLARHSTIDLTMNIYTSLTVHDQASALTCLPPVPAIDEANAESGALRATGTDGPEKVPTVVPRGAENGAIRLASESSEPAPNCTDNEGNRRDASRPKHARNPEKIGVSCTALRQSASICTAEREGFEPSVPLRAHRFSRPAQSTTLASL